MAFTIEHMRQWIEDAEKGMPYAHRTKGRELEAVEDGIKDALQQGRYYHDPICL